MFGLFVRPTATHAANRARIMTRSQHGFGKRSSHVQDGKIRIAIVGVGKCASSLVHEVVYYNIAVPDQFVPRG